MLWCDHKKLHKYKNGTCDIFIWIVKSALVKIVAYNYLNDWQGYIQMIEKKKNKFNLLLLTSLKKILKKMVWFFGVLEEHRRRPESMQLCWLQKD